MQDRADPGRYDGVMPAGHRKSLMRSLGEFFGHIVHATKTDVSQTEQRTVLRHDVQEEQRSASGGVVTLRRTTTEEIEYRPPNAKEKEHTSR